MTFSFNSAGGLIIVRTEVIGPSGSGILRLALDTGATSTLVDARVLRALGCDPALTTDRVQMTTASGVEFAPRLRINALAALGRRRDDCTVVAHTLPPTAVFDGLLGLDFFRGTVLTIDFQHGEITVV
jgi:predicted aspartyl protease